MTWYLKISISMTIIKNLVLVLDISNMHSRCGLLDVVALPFCSYSNYASKELWWLTTPIRQTFLHRTFLSVGTSFGPDIGRGSFLFAISLWYFGFSINLEIGVEGDLDVDLCFLNLLNSFWPYFKDFFTGWPPLSSEEECSLGVYYYCIDGRKPPSDILFVLWFVLLIVSSGF